MPGLGTLINGLTVIGGGLAGLIFRKGLPQRFQITLMQALGLSSIFIGIAGALEKMLVIQASGICVQGTMLAVLSLAAGAVLGEGINLEYRFEQFGSWLKKKTGSDEDEPVHGSISHRFVNDLRRRDGDCRRIAGWFGRRSVVVDHQSRAGLSDHHDLYLSLRERRYFFRHSACLVSRFDNLISAADRSSAQRRDDRQPGDDRLDVNLLCRRQSDV